MKGKLLIISGCHPGVSGLGRVISYLRNQSYDNEFNAIPCRFIFRSGGLTVGKYIKSFNFIQALKNTFKIILGEFVFRFGLINVDDDEEIVLIHPQSLGFDWCINFIEDVHKPVWFYLMDSSFFCVRSYNHVTTEIEPCLRCLGGDFENIDRNNCVPFPRNDISSRIFVKKLVTFVTQNKLKFLVQNNAQKSLVERHFTEENLVVKTIGLWANDWSFKKTTIPDVKQYSFDVVYHGPEFEAKGFLWTVEVAKLLPNYKFLFPFKERKDIDGVPRNCYFQAISWESGLKSNVESSRITIVPSLWSAPIEGALVKSIACAKITAVVENSTAYSSELSDNVVLKLPPDVTQAANLLGDILKQVNSNYNILDEAKNNEFINEFERKNKNLLSRLMATVREGNEL